MNNVTVRCVFLFGLLSVGTAAVPEYTRTMLNKLRRYSPEDVASLRAYPRRQHRSEIEARYTAQLPPQQAMKLFDRYCGARSA